MPYAPHLLDPGPETLFIVGADGSVRKTKFDLDEEAQRILESVCTDPLVNLLTAGYVLIKVHRINLLKHIHTNPRFRISIAATARALHGAQRALNTAAGLIKFLEINVLGANVPWRLTIYRPLPPLRPGVCQLQVVQTETGHGVHFLRIYLRAHQFQNRIIENKHERESQT